MPKLTKRLVETVEPGPSPIFVWEAETPGFGLKVLPSGQRRYVAKYRVGGGRSARQRWYMIGSHGTLTCDQAREIARDVLSLAAKGGDPQGTRVGVRDAATVRDLWSRYQEEHLPRKKPKSAHHDQQLWRLYIEPALASHRLSDVSRADIAALHQKLAARPYQANRLLALLSKMFNLAEGWGMRPDASNPCRHVEKFRERSRERYLNADEIARLAKALDDGVRVQTLTPYMAAAVRLLLLTGARLNEVLTARWEWVDWERRLIALPDSKTGAKPLYLSATAIEILRDLQSLPTSEASPFILRGRSADRPLVNLAKPWNRICEMAELEGVRLHDLRHTAASVAVGQGVSLPIIGRLLGHSQASTTQRYAHVDADPALAAADRVGEMIGGAMGRRSGE